MASGKSTLGKKLSEKLGLKYYDMDDIFWEKKYTMKRSNSECKKLLAKLVKKDKWVVEGCFSRWIEPAVRRSQVIVWLDLPFLILVYRLLIRKVFRGRLNWGEFYRQTIQNYRYSRYRKHHPKLITKDYEKGIMWPSRKRQTAFIRKHGGKVIHLKSQKEVSEWLGAL